MQVTSQVDEQSRSITFTTEFAAPVERVWQLYADARQLERVWGPPEFPATFIEHELRPGTTSKYTMSDGNETYHGYWSVLEVDEPHSFTVRDGFATEDFQPVGDMPEAVMRFEFSPTPDGGTRAIYTSTLDSVEELRQMVEMGVIDGTIAAIGQVDAHLTR